MSLRPYPINNSPINTWINNVVRGNNANGIIVGDGLSLENTVNGKVLKLDDSVYNHHLNFVGDFNISQSYNINDVVTVQPDTVYYKYDGSVATDIAVGTFVCIRQVPAIDYNESASVAVRSYYQSWGGDFTTEIVNSFRWNLYNIYYPVDTVFTQSYAIEMGFNIDKNCNFWKRIGSVPAVSSNQYFIKSIAKDYYVCRSTYTSASVTTTGSTDVYVAKPYKLRGSITSATIEGVAVTYTYIDTTSYLYRSGSAGGTKELQKIVPRYITGSAGDIIYGQTVDHTNIYVSGSELKIIDSNVDARAWARTCVQ